MGRKTRILTRPNALVEVVQRAFQGRFLIKAGPRMNLLIVGALAKAKADHGVQIHGGAFLNGHFHLLTSAPTVKTLADFMRDFTRKLSIEAGRLHDWDESVFPRRYHCTEISDEPAAQLARLRYCLRHGTKENLVASPLDWPGVPFAEAMISGEPLKGVWIDRVAYHQARSKGQQVSLGDFTEELDLELIPLPCLESLDRSQRRSAVLDLIRGIEEETAARHRADGTTPLGVEAATAVDPHEGPRSFEPSPEPWFHAFSKSTRYQMKEAFLFIAIAYREAAKRLKEGDFGVVFPENTFPPARPFVQPTWGLEVRDTVRLEPG